MRHGVYYSPKAVPCECGSTDAYWHGPEDGARVYCCDACWCVKDAQLERATHPRTVARDEARK